VVQDLDAAEPVLLHGGERSLNPASLMKLVTTLAVLDSFGPATPQDPRPAGRHASGTASSTAA